MKNVIVVDRQDITRIGIESLLRDSKNASSVIKADDKKELIKLLSSQPDSVVILDYSLSDFVSVDDLLNVSSRFADSRWLLFSDELSGEFLRRLLFSCEAFSVVLKSCDLDEINAGLVHLLRNERFICGRVTNQLLSAQKPNVEKNDHTLTATEKEILKEIALGKTTKEIAATRNLSFHTIITHRKNIFRKLEVNNVHEATKYAMRAGIIDVAEYYI
ncbi:MULTISPECIES: response regulator transcription factor [unclassified Dysgonomonas]|uniref:response regulator transcription factor n=1 Tax=unclassified Dysgonomonas TaxID=2630389 RepID=UPI0013EB5103|nr:MULTISPECIES: response regulator transcription factor [unclassified Dysgonomonas]